MSDTTNTRAPAIADLSWGSIDTDAGSFRDAKLWPGGGRNWDWNETGTHHSPGVQTDDVQELVDNGAEIVVLGRGQQQRLQVPDTTVRWLEEQGVEVEVLESGAAVERYNELASDGRAVGALIHTTC